MILNWSKSKLTFNAERKEQIVLCPYEWSSSSFLCHFAKDIIFASLSFLYDAFKIPWVFLGILFYKP